MYCIIENKKKMSSNIIVNEIYIEDMNYKDTLFTDLRVIEPKVYGDERGWFVETYQKNKYTEFGIKENFVQDNMSFSRYGVLRGLHLQYPLQDKLVQVLKGTIYDVAVDARVASPTFGKWYGLLLSEKNKKQFWIPKGFAHGFLVLSEDTIFSYKCTDFYNSDKEVVLAWDDPNIGIEWPLPRDVDNIPIKPILSDKDKNGISLEEFKVKNENENS